MVAINKNEKPVALLSLNQKGRLEKLLNIKVQEIYTHIAALVSVLQVLLLPRFGSAPLRKELKDNQLHEQHQLYQNTRIPSTIHWPSRFVDEFTMYILVNSNQFIWESCLIPWLVPGMFFLIKGASKIHSLYEFFVSQVFFWVRHFLGVPTVALIIQSIMQIIY